MSEEREGIVVLVDENGEEVEFEHLDTIEMNDEQYVVLVPASEQGGDDEETEVIILKVEQGAEGEDDSFLSIDDEDELSEVFEEFMARTEEEYEFIEED